VSAWQKFDPDRGVKFDTYANYWIRARLWLAVVSLGYPVRYPREVMKSVRSIGDKIPFGSSFDQPIRGTDISYSEVITDEEQTEPMLAAERAALSDMLSEVMNDVLSQREADILRQCACDETPMAELGRKHGISRERTRQLYERSLQRVRTSPRAAKLLEFLEAS
jgi:RNA polymerase sigma factor (sigma-70 family)